VGGGAGKSGRSSGCNNARSLCNILLDAELRQDYWGFLIRMS
jgi:hypothetical protein